MEDWAEKRAAEWLETVELDDERDISSLAALLREVWEEGLKAGTTREAEALHRADTMLAEVRRVVEEEKAKKMMVPFTPAAFGQWDRCCDEILSRLERL